MTAGPVRGCDVHGHAYPTGSQVCGQCGHIADTVVVSKADLLAVVEFMETNSEFDQDSDPEVFAAHTRLLETLGLLNDGADDA